ncbi:conjugal transfer protein TrbN [Yersinia massiliensis]|uniref:Conjugal transfer protein TrbN n=1 Tax=Yersinia massiliensis TaxID=419257 RepID=A0ABM6V0N5_9GAMM|nr:conjugal transfer protein TrbN [Yersinia massiliensis]AVX40729.1 conjugal transfer protein TrbN [Yersinia massiliensis]
MVFLDLPPQLHERVVCSITSALKYEVPANIVLGIAEKEGGKPGQWVKNTNGTHDVGPLQFNTQYLKELSKYGITAEDVAQAGCYSYDLAAWRLRGHLMNDKGDIWTRAANYHSRTPKFNAPYRADLIQKATKWGDWLEARFVTYTVTTPGAAPARIASRITTVAKPQSEIVKKTIEVKSISNIEKKYNPAAAQALASVFAPKMGNN